MKSRLFAIGGLATALALTPIAAHAAPNSGSSSSGSTTATTTGTTTATTTPTSSSTATTVAKPTTPSTSTSTGKYEVLSGTFTTAARADKHLKAIEAAGVKGLSVKVLGKTTKRYLVEERGLTRAEAKAKVKALRAAKFTATYFLR